MVLVSTPPMQNGPHISNHRETCRRYLRDAAQEASTSDGTIPRLATSAAAATIPLVVGNGRPCLSTLIGDLVTAKGHRRSVSVSLFAATRVGIGKFAVGRSAMFDYAMGHSIVPISSKSHLVVVHLLRNSSGVFVATVRKSPYEAVSV
jgi:hypothetical protein